MEGRIHGHVTRRWKLYKVGLLLQFFTWSCSGTENAREGVPKLGAQEPHMSISEPRPDMLHKQENL